MSKKPKNTDWQSEQTKYAVLVYQAGIANVFEVQCLNMASFGRDAKRLIQADFRTCETYARALAHAGYKIASAACNQAGDIINATWSENLEDAPFSDQFCPVWYKVNFMETVNTEDK